MSNPMSLNLNMNSKIIAGVDESKTFDEYLPGKFQGNNNFLLLVNWSLCIKSNRKHHHKMETKKFYSSSSDTKVFLNNKQV